MTRTAGGILVLLAFAPALLSPDKPEKSATPAEQYKAILAVFKEAVADSDKALASAKTPEQRQKIHSELDAKIKSTTVRAMELAEKAPNDPIALNALFWVDAKTPLPDKDPDSPRLKALKILARDYAGNDKIDGIINDRRLYDWNDATVKLLREVMEKNPKREIQGKACLMLAQQADARLQMAEDFKDNPDPAKRSESFFGKKTVEELLKADPDKLRKEAQTHYERLAKDYGDLPASQGGTMGKLAEVKLDTLRHSIVIGKPAPEIEGEDIDGKKFKLSDYRGKVVLLDFWGNW